MKEIVINIENECFAQINVYDYEKFTEADKNLLEDLKEWLYPEIKEEPTSN